MTQFFAWSSWTYRIARDLKQEPQQGEHLLLGEKKRASRRKEGQSEHRG